LPNVEHTEQDFPVLFLYRKEVVDSGGAGKWRGGVSAESCFIPHRTDYITQDTLSSGNAIPTSTGMMGGYPASVNVYKFKRGTDIKDRMARRQMPGDIAEVSGKDEVLGLRQQNFTQKPEDVYAVIWTGAGGFGDPFERDAERVQADWENRIVSVEAALDIYGVVLSAKGELDAAATAKLRAGRRLARVRKNGAGKKLGGPVVSRPTENLVLRREKSGVHTCCAKCDTDLGSTRENYKDHCVREDQEINRANPNIGDYKRYIDEKPVWRQFFCPGCGALIENEIAREGEELLRDIELSAK
jgi:N-methylhydantoinase B